MKNELHIWLGNTRNEFKLTLSDVLEDYSKRGSYEIMDFIQLSLDALLFIEKQKKKN